MKLSTYDGTAEEPHLLYADPVDAVGLVQIDTPASWPGGYLRLAVSGSATYAVDYALDSSLVGGVLTVYVDSGARSVFVGATALQDNDEADDGEVVHFAWAPSQDMSWFNYTGSGTVSINDLEEGLQLTADPGSTLEVGGPPGTFHIKAKHAGYTLDTTVQFEIDASGESDADFLSDYGLDFETDPPITWTETYSGSDVWRSSEFAISGDTDYLIDVIAVLDKLLEGTEDVRAVAIATAPLVDSRSNEATVSIEEEYLKAKSEKEEYVGCGCTCPTCVGDVAFEIERDDAVAQFAGGILETRTDSERALHPTAKISLRVPADKAVPESIEVVVHAVEKDVDANGNLVGIGARSIGAVSGTLVFQVDTANVSPGDWIEFRIQLDLTSVVTSQAALAGQNIDLELLAHPTFPSATSYLDKFNGWVGRYSHTVRDLRESGVAPGFAPGLSWNGLGWMSPMLDRLVPDTSYSHPGYVKVEQGRALVRGDGSTSWYKNGSETPPETHSTLAGNILTHHDGSSDQFDAAGRQIASLDAAGNQTAFGYNASGWLSTITDPAGRQTTVTYTGFSSTGPRTITLSDAFGAQTTLVWDPAAKTLTVTNPDPDGGSGPREPLQEIVQYSDYGFLTSISKGPVGGLATQTASFGHNFDPLAGAGLQGDRGLLSITRSGVGTTTIDASRRREALISYGASGTILATNPWAIRKLVLAPDGSPQTYTRLTSVTDSLGNRTLYRLDHRGRPTEAFDPQQVADLGLATASLGDASGLAAADAVLQANASLGHEWTRASTTRDGYGRITGTDLGEILVATGPDPDNFVHRTDLPLAEQVDGPLGRPVETASYTDGNRTSLQVSSLGSLAWEYDSTFNEVTLATDENGNQLRRTIDPLTGLVTQEQRAYTGWQNYIDAMDVNQDGVISPLDGLIVNNYVNNNPGGVLPPDRTADDHLLDVNGDGSATSDDANIITNYLNYSGGGDTFHSTLDTTVDFEYTSTSAGDPLNGLLTKQTIHTGRSAGDLVTQYVYYDTPTNPATHARLWKVIEAPGTAIEATTTYSYDARGNVSQVVDSAGRVTEWYYDTLDRLTATLYPDPDGTGPLLSVVERFDYDAFGNATATELVNSYVDNGQLLVTSRVDGYTYDSLNRPTGEYQQDPDLVWYLYLDGSGNIARTSDQAVALASTAVTTTALAGFASANSRVSTSSTVGSTVTPATDAGTRGLVRTYTWDTGGNLIESTSYDGTLATPDYRTTTYHYDPLGRPTMIVTPDPGASAATVSGEVRNSNSADGEVGGYVTTVIYDNAGNTWRTTDPLASAIDLRHDLVGRLTSVIEPASSGGTRLSSSTAYTSTPIGWQTTDTDAAGRETLTEYDFLGRAFRTTLPGETTSSTQPLYRSGFFHDGLLSESVDPEGRLVSHSYDARGRLTSTTGINAASYTYTIDGLLESITDPLGRVTSFVYDAGGRLSQRISPDPDGAGAALASTVQYTRDALGNIIAISDSAGETTTTVLDSRFRPISSTDAGGFTTEYTYDVFGNLVSVTDAKANETTFAYDRLGRSYQETKGTDSRTSLLDGAGNVRQTTDRNGRVIEYEYDHLYRLSREVWLDSSSQEIREFVYTHDAVGNLLTVADNHIDPSTGTRTAASDSMEYVYDDLDRVQIEEVTNPLIGTSGARTLFDHEYNLSGQRTSVAADLGGTIWGSTVLSGVGDFMNTYSYDGYGRLASVSQGSNGGNAIAPKTATFAYNAANQLTDLRRYNWPSASSAELDVHSRYAYDGAGRLESISHSKTEIAAGETWDGTSTLPTSLQGGSLLAGYLLEYDQENHLTSWSSYADAFETTFSYDVRDQLAGATHAQISGLTLPRALPSSESYTFDGTGNRELSGNSTSTDGSHNQVQNDGTYTYAYDAEGNQTSRTSIATGAVTEYDFDYRNRLVRVTERASSGGAATSIVEFHYDAFDRRTGKEIDSDGDGDVERATAWVWDGNQVVLQYADADGAGPAAWKLTNRYLYGEAIDQILADEQLPGDGISITAATLTTGEVLWPLTDHLGSVRDLVDSAGVVREHVVYDSFGDRLSESDFDSSGTPIASSHTSAVDHLFGYTGREWDADIELQYNRARWYDPTQGRWISQDPIGFEAGDANLYQYVGNEPTTSTDPSGLATVWENGGVWQLEDATLTNRGHYGEIFAGEHRPGTSALRRFLMDGPVQSWFSAGTIHRGTFAGTLRLNDTVVCENGKKISVDIRIQFAMEIRLKTLNRLTTLSLFLRGIGAGGAAVKTIHGINTLQFTDKSIDAFLNSLDFHRKIQEVFSETRDLDSLRTIFDGDAGSIKVSPSIICESGVDEIALVVKKITLSEAALGFGYRREGRSHYDPSATSKWSDGMWNTDEVYTVPNIPIPFQGENVVH